MRGIAPTTSDFHATASQELSKIQGLVSCLLEGCEEISEADPAIRVDAPPQVPHLTVKNNGPEPSKFP